MMFSEIDMFLLDTCFILELLGNRPKAVAWLENHKNEKIFIPGWVIIELMKGKKSKKEMEQVISVLKTRECVWPKEKFCEEIPEKLVALHTQRTPDGKLQGNAIFDVLIYITAKSHGLTLVTMDTDFERDFKDLSVETIKSS